MQRSLAFEDTPVVITHERRVQPDRRAKWRGGRRDTDWITRPPGALERLGAPPTRSGIRRWFSLSLWSF